MLGMLQTIIAFLAAFASLVVVHELGHYLVARWCGVKVLRFSVGFGRVLWMRRFGADQTEWAISAIPLGGYVKMLDAREQDMQDIPLAERAREFTSQSVWARIAILVAGPLANFLLAIGLLAGLHLVGMPEPLPILRDLASKQQDSPAWQAGLRGGETVLSVNGEEIASWNQLRKHMLYAALEKKDVTLKTSRGDAQDPEVRHLQTVRLALVDLSPEELEGDFMSRLGLELARPPAVLGRMAADGPAAIAGFQVGDKVLAVNGQAVRDSLEFVETVRRMPGVEMRVSVQRAGQTLEILVTPVAQEVQGKRIGRLQVEISAVPQMTVVQLGPLESLAAGVADTWNMSVMSLKMLGKMLVGEVSWRNLTGPLTIADYAGQTAKTSWVSYLNFIAFVSLSLGVMNLLPIPMLDGGYLLYYSLEILRGRPLPPGVLDIAQRAGVGILMTLMAVAMLNDIARLLS